MMPALARHRRAGIVAHRVPQLSHVAQREVIGRVGPTHPCGHPQDGKTYSPGTSIDRRDPRYGAVISDFGDRTTAGRSSANEPYGDGARGSALRRSRHESVAGSAQRRTRSQPTCIRDLIPFCVPRRDRTSEVRAQDSVLAGMSLATTVQAAGDSRIPRFRLLERGRAWRLRFRWWGVSARPSGQGHGWD